jgi:hypothetical protein
MAAAAGRQARLWAGREDRRKRSQPEQQNQKNRELAPHPSLTLFEKQSVRVNRNINPRRLRIVRALGSLYHPIPAITLS